MTPQTDLTPLMLPVGTTRRAAAAARPVPAPGLVPYQDLLLTAPAVLAVLLGVLLRAV